MQPLIQLIVLSSCLVCLAFYSAMIALKLSKHTRSSRNSENIFQRILELIKESAITSKAKP